MAAAVAAETKEDEYRDFQRFQEWKEALNQSGHGTGGNYVRLKQVSEVRSMGSSRKNLQRCLLGVRMHVPSWSWWSWSAVGGPGSPHSDSVLGQIPVPTKTNEQTRFRMA